MSYDRDRLFEVNILLAVVESFARRFCKLSTVRSEVCMNVSTLVGFRKVSKEMYITVVFAAFDDH